MALLHGGLRQPYNDDRLLREEVIAALNQTFTFE